MSDAPVEIMVMTMVKGRPIGTPVVLVNGVEVEGVDAVEVVRDAPPSESLGMSPRGTALLRPIHYELRLKIPTSIRVEMKPNAQLVESRGQG